MALRGPGTRRTASGDPEEWEVGVIFFCYIVCMGLSTKILKIS
jgi:hypothetical protein